MKRLILLILLFLNFSISYSIVYNEQDYNPSVSYNFKSTSPIDIHYYTVKPINPDGSVSGEYTTSKYMASPKYGKGLDLDDGDEPNASLVPIGDPDIPIILFLTICYFICGLLFRRNEVK